MSPPQLTISQQGTGIVSADLLNTYEQTCDTFADLRNFTGVSGMQVYARGGAAIADGLQGVFYWNASVSNPVDNNATIIVPNGSVQGAWLIDPLPSPTATNLGGVKSAVAPSGQFMTGIDTSGNPTFVSSTGAGVVQGPATTVVGFIPRWGNTTGTLLTAGAAATASAPQVTIYLSGSGTYTTPAGALYLAVEMIGAGSGGGGAGTTGSPGGASTAGGATTFGSALLTANGGPAAPATSSNSIPTPATATGGDDNIVGALGGPAYEGFTTSNAGGVAGAGTFYGGGGMPGAQTIIPAAATSYGAGGGGGVLTSTATALYGWGGNAGAFLRKIVTTPAANYAYAIGAAGAGGSAGTSGTVGAVGAPGYIRVTAYFQ